MFYLCLFDSIQIKNLFFLKKFIIIRGLCFYKKETKMVTPLRKKIGFPFCFYYFCFLGDVHGK